MDNRYWTSVSSSADGSKLLAVAYDGYDHDGNDIWTSTDGGSTWVNRNVQRTSFTMDSFTASASSSDGTKLVIGLEDGSVYRSTDSGASWHESMNDAGNATLVLASNSTGTKLAIGKPGEIYVSTDSGTTWDSVTDPAMVTNDGAIRGLKYVGTSTIYASQNGGDLWKSTDDGQTWTNLTEGNEEMTGSAWEQLGSSADGLKVIVGTDYGSIWMTDAGGTSWTDAKDATPGLNNKYFWALALAGDGSKAYAPAWEGDIWGAPADGSGDAGQGSDTDGVSDATEDAAPNGGDANNDGIVDSQQSNVVSLLNATTGEYVALATDGTCSLSNISALPSSNLASDSKFIYPLGLLDFSISCGGTPGFSTTVTQYFYSPPSGDFVLRKFVKGSYATVPGASISHTTIGGKNVMVISYQVTDGGPLDDDGAANGVIVDPAGPALQSATNGLGAPNTGLLHQDIWLSIGAVMSGVALLLSLIPTLRRKLYGIFSR
jgi:photosystem II stability/assembly factor-like uncharacterized protein